LWWLILQALRHERFELMFASNGAQAAKIIWQPA
jgi:hypothetical protein